MAVYSRNPLVWVPIGKLNNNSTNKQIESQTHLSLVLKPAYMQVEDVRTPEMSRLTEKQRGIVKKILYMELTQVSCTEPSPQPH